MILNEVESKIAEYRNYDDEYKMLLYYFLIGKKTRIKNGYNKSFAELLKENSEISEIKSYLMGYEE